VILLYLLVLTIGIALCIGLQLLVESRKPGIVSRFYRFILDEGTKPKIKRKVPVKTGRAVISNAYEKEVK